MAYTDLDPLDAFATVPSTWLAQLLENTERLHDGTGFEHGVIRSRQGGTSGDGSWRTSGTTNTDTRGKTIIIQVGTIGTSTGGDITVTFNVPYAQIPHILVSVVGNNAGTGGVTQNAFAVVNSITTTSFTVRTVNDAGTASNQAVSWQATGQI